MKSAENVAVDAVTSDKFPSLKSVGFHPRTPTLGAEYSMVKDYAEKIIAENFKGNGLDKSIIVFVEPRMESAFPDLVVAYYHEELLSAWSETRRHLNKTDLKVMHHIYCKGAVKTAAIKNIFPGSALKSLRRLSNSGLIFGDGKDWKSAPVHEVFAVYKLVAIEANINDWRSGISQAFRNTWFASEVYLLLPSIRNKGQIGRAHV